MARENKTSAKRYSTLKNYKCKVKRKYKYYFKIFDDALFQSGLKTDIIFPEQ